MPPVASETDPVPRVLMVTNDFPPRVGGVQQYEWNVVRHLPPDRVMVLAPNWDGWRPHDAQQEFAVRRWPARYLWPTPEVERRVLDLVREHRADVVLFGQGLPIALLGPGLARRGIPYAVLTHGVELWMARVPTARALLRQALRDARAVTAVSHYTADAVQAAIPPGIPVTLLPPAVDEARFTPNADGGAVRERLGLGDAPVVVCVSRLVRRKGQDVLIRAMPMIRDRVPDARLVIVGDGPYREALETLAAESPPGSVLFTGEVADEELPAHHATADVFAMPCRSRWGGLEVEGFGIVYLEAGATARPSVAGRSGGAAEAVVDEETGLLVEGAEPKAVALAVAQLLANPAQARTMGEAGRRRVEESFTWRRRAQELAAVLVRAAG
ncbi:MAG TPA: glycosyltransferase family 4 protein [Actinomycetota bacterium]|nr:glycosyltransferase family 4 protein [Actinomycetota bacterium]